MILIAILSFVAGAAALYVTLRLMGRKRAIKTMDVILVFVFTVLVVFTVVMIILFTKYGQTPDTLITCVFGALAGECGIMGWIKTTKDRNRERKWQKEDEAEMKGNGN